MTGRVFACPEEKLAGEIELAIAYAVACNPDRGRLLLLSPPDGRRAELACQVAQMLLEQAGHGLSGLAVTGSVSGHAELTWKLRRPGPCRNPAPACAVSGEQGVTC